MEIEKSLIVRLVLLLTLMAVAGGIYFWGKEKHIPINEKVNKINKELTYVSIEQNTILSIGDQDDKPIYEICIKEKYLKRIYFFNPKQYIIETGASSTSRNRPLSICDLIDSLKINEKENFKNAIRKYKATVEFSLLSSLKINAELQEYVSELLYSITSIGKDYSIDIYLKGFADGYLNEWKLPIDKNPRYQFKEIEYLCPLDTNSLNPFAYTTKKGMHVIRDNFFSNKDLPDLRAMFVKTDFVEPLLKGCSSKVRNIYILRGFEFSKDTINPSQRNVQIFIKLVSDE